MRREDSYKSRFLRGFDTEVNNTALGELRCEGDSVDQTVEWITFQLKNVLNGGSFPSCAADDGGVGWKIQWLGEIFKSLIFKSLIFK